MRNPRSHLICLLSLPVIWIGPPTCSYTMPGTALLETPRHIPPHPTKANCEMDFADLAIIDLAKFGTPEGKAELVKDVCNAMNTIGFFYVINHGYSQEQVFLL
ncbi:hypothetical protein E4T56_gene573 [Termitomyces sp. T112]|nr:hypothetical protein E4T56_gene15119 [Termitomyces sp. T112]KAG5726810.1 hypothetical protein E4T56_gene573 [Termitomyces sp. T112]